MRGRGVLLSALLVGSSVLSAAPAAAAAAEAESSSITVVVPAPGNVTTWTMPVVNPQAGAVDVTLEAAVLGSTGALPLTFSLFDPVLGEFVVDDVVIESALAAVPVGRLEAAESRDLMAHLRMSAEAGNEFQGVSQSMLFTQSFAAVGESGPPETDAPGSGLSPWLAETGMAASLIFVLATLLVLMGIAVLARRRR